MTSEHARREEEHREAFGERVGISQSCRNEIVKIKNNDSALTGFYLQRKNSERFSALAWNLLGSYIAGNDHLDHIDLSAVHLADATMDPLFKRLMRARAVEVMDLSGNEFGLDGILCMVSFLQNTQSLTELKIGTNDRIDAECFRLLINTLHLGSIKKLHLGECNVDDVSALEECHLPNLRHLDLDHNDIRNLPSLEKYTNLDTLWLEGNNIGSVGCRSIAKLLQNKNSRLRILDLTSNDLSDEEAEMLAGSLKNNATLEDLSLGDSNIREGGCRAFLRLLNDSSSIDRTYNSNHTLRALQLPYPANAAMAEMDKCIASAIRVNQKHWADPEAAGRIKVVRSQLDSRARMDLCRLQGVGHSHGSLFAEIETNLLPNILALVGKNHGQNNLHRMLVATAPDLTALAG